MIDIHTHILPGCDDGAKDIDEALGMARRAVSDGVRQVVATPHSTVEPQDPTTIRAKAADLQRALDEAGIDLRLHTGLEVMLTPFTAERYRAGSIFAINEGRYMLVELPSTELPPFLDESIFALQLAGVTPVLAHPERHPAVVANLTTIEGLVERGVLVQITAGSILGAFGRTIKGLAQYMLSEQLAHVIASDAHSATERAPVLSAARDRAAQFVGREAAHAMVTTVPAAIVAGAEVEIPEPLVEKPRRSWFFWSSSK